MRNAEETNLFLTQQLSRSEGRELEAAKERVGVEKK